MYEYTSNPDFVGPQPFIPEVVNEKRVVDVIAGSKYQPWEWCNVNATKDVIRDLQQAAKKFTNMIYEQRMQLNHVSASSFIIRYHYERYKWLQSHGIEDQGQYVDEVTDLFSVHDTWNGRQAIVVQKGLAGAKDIFIFDWTCYMIHTLMVDFGFKRGEALSHEQVHEIIPERADRVFLNHFWNTLYQQKQKSEQLAKQTTGE